MTFAQTNTNNVLETSDVKISIDPTAGVINQVIHVGEDAVGSIEVESVGTDAAALFLTADWGPSAGTTDRKATLLANALTVSVFVSSDGAGVPSTDVYAGRFMDMVDVSIFAELNPGDSADVAISVTLPDTHSGYGLMGTALHTDFVFVALPAS